MRTWKFIWTYKQILYFLCDVIFPVLCDQKHLLMSVVLPSQVHHGSTTDWLSTYMGIQSALTCLQVSNFAFLFGWSFGFNSSVVTIGALGYVYLSLHACHQQICHCQIFPWHVALCYCQVGEADRAGIKGKGRWRSLGACGDCLNFYLDKANTWEKLEQGKLQRIISWWKRFRWQMRKCKWGNCPD